jgi:hypothetical protein
MNKGGTRHGHCRRTCRLRRVADKVDAGGAPLPWVPKMPSESFRPEFHQINEFNFDSAFVNSDNSASHSLGQTNLRKIRPSFRDGPFGLVRRINLIAPSRFLRLDLPPISIREHINRAGFKLPADTGDAGHRPRRLR